MVNLCVFHNLKNPKKQNKKLINYPPTNECSPYTKFFLPLQMNYEVMKTVKI